MRVGRAIWPLLGVAAVALTLVNFVLGGDVWSLSFLGFGVVGTFVAWRVPGHPTGRLMIGLSVVTALAESEALDQAAAATRGVGAAMPLLMGLFLLTFPSGRFVWSRWRQIALLALGVTATGFVVAARVGDEGPFVVVPLMVFLGGAVVDLILRYRRESGVEKAQMKLVVVATVASVSVLVLPVLFGIPDVLYDISVVTAFTLIPAAVGGAILKYRLYDIDRLFSRTVAYTIIVTLLAMAYTGTVSVTTSLMPTQSSLVVAASTLAVAAIFNPMRKRVQRIVDRRFNRSSYQAQFISEEFSLRLREPLTLEGLSQAWAQTVDQTLQPGTSSVWINSRSTAARQSWTRPI